MDLLQNNSGVGPVKAGSGLTPGPAAGPVENLVGLLDAKRSSKGWVAHCPAHDDTTPSLSIDEGADGRALVICHAGCSIEAVLAKLGLKLADLFPVRRKVRRRYSSVLNPGCALSVSSPTPAPAPFNWQTHVDALKDKDLVRLGNERWFSRAFCSSLHKRKLLGLHNCNFAFSVSNNGSVVGAHVRQDNGKWFYTPKGIKTAPLVIGDLTKAIQVHISESTLDTCSVADRTDLYLNDDVVFVATRGSGNAKLLADLPLRENARIYAWPQNDEPGQKWLEDVLEIYPEARLVKTPTKFKDPGEWTKAAPDDGGASKDDLLHAIEEASHLHNSPNPVGKAGNCGDGDAQSNCEISEPVELPAPPAPYVSPPLTLLPPQLQEYVHAAAESLNVDVAFGLLPLLSALGSAIGNSRSILLKRGFIQPPVIWTGIIGSSGQRKSPSIEAGCFAVWEHECELVRQNKQAQKAYEEELAAWEAKGRKERGAKPQPPVYLTCWMDDLTLEVLADALQQNSRVLLKKDELSHWFASFDQYRMAKGADVARWLSLHTAVSFGLDRRTDKRRYRIRQPRVCITGGIQPRVLKRVLTEDFFERGLPARFLFAAPPTRRDEWSEDVIPEKLQGAVLDLFDELWLLQPGRDENDNSHPVLLTLEPEAKNQFVTYYNECGGFAFDGDERAEAAWNKLTGYAARLALVGQLAVTPGAETVTGEVMQAACDLARWFGREAERIYAVFSETPAEREQRQLIEFIEKRGGPVSVRDVTHGCWAYRNQSDEAERVLNTLVRNGFGEWLDPKPGSRGQPARKFRLLTGITITANHSKHEGKTPNTGDGEVLESVQNTEMADELEATPTGILEL
jgi:hypothetical protein